MSAVRLPAPVMATSTPFAIATLDAFCARLLEWLADEIVAQQEALRCCSALGESLIACSQPAVVAAQDALQRWETAHQPLLARQQQLEADWRAMTGELALSISRVLAWLQQQAPESDWEWRLAEQSGQLQDLIQTLARQAELNHLLIAQHADVQQQTWMLFAHALQGVQPGNSGYDDRGQSRALPAGATLLDARG